MEEPEGSVEVGDIEIAYRITGEGRPLLMIIGLGSSKDLWEPAFLNLLAREFEVITFDSRGMGGTPPGTEEFTIDRFALDTAGLMEAIGIERAHVLGYSMGGYIAQELALNFPDKVEKLVLLDTEPGSDNGTCIARDILNQLADMSGTAEDRSRRLNRFLYPQTWLGEHEEDLKEAFADHYDHPPDGIAVMKQAAAMCDWKGTYDRLSMLHCPTLVITGSDDEVITPENSRRLAERIPDARVIEVEGAGHGILFQFPAEVAGMVREFLISREFPRRGARRQGR